MDAKRTMPLVNLASVALVAIVALTSAVSFIWLTEVVRGSTQTAHLARDLVDAHRPRSGDDVDGDAAERGARHAALSVKSDLLTQQVNAMAANSTRALVTVAAAAFTTTSAAAILLVLVSRRIASPIGLLLDATRHIADGDFRHRVVYNARDELGSLARAFDRMAARLEASRSEVAHHKRALEVGIEKATAELRALSRTDDVTGLPNLRHLADVFDGLAASARASGAPLTLGVLGIDDFADINLRYGYGAGNLVLTAFARIVQAAARDGDAVARGNGVQFLVLMPGLPELSAGFLGQIEAGTESIQRLIRHRTGHEIHLAAHRGFAAFPGDGESLSALLAAALRQGRGGSPCPPAAKTVLVGGRRDCGCTGSGRHGPLASPTARSAVGGLVATVASGDLPLHPALSGSKGEAQAAAELPSQFAGTANCHPRPRRGREGATE